MTNCETFYDADPECSNMFPPLCGVGGTCGKPRLSSRSWRQLESWRRWSKLAELNGAKTDRTIDHLSPIHFGPGVRPRRRDHNSTCDLKETGGIASALLMLVGKSLCWVPAGPALCASWCGWNECFAVSCPNGSDDSVLPALAGPGGNGVGFTQTNGAGRATIVGNVWRLIASSGNPPGAQRVRLAIACFHE